MQNYAVQHRLGLAPCMQPSAAISHRNGRAVCAQRQRASAPSANLHGPSQPPARHQPKDAKNTAADTQAQAQMLAARQGGVTDAHIADYRTFFDSQWNEYDYWIDEAWVEGTIPEGLKGSTYLQIGAGLMNVFGRQVQHPSDGDGMVSSVAFDGAGNAFFRNRYIRTKAFTGEQAAGRSLYRGAFDVGAVNGPAWLFNPLTINYKSETANEGIAYWGGKLYGLSQHGMPHELHKLSMDTIGESTLGGILGDGKMLSGHSRVVRDAATGQQRWVTFGGGQSVNDALVSFWEFDESGALAASHNYKLCSALGRTLHDLSVTPDYYILWQSPLKFNLQKFALEFCRGSACLAECVELVEGEPGKLHLVPRPGGAAAGTKPIVLKAPPLVAYHHVNAFQTTSPNGTKHLTLDLLAMQQADYSNRLSTLSPATFSAGAKPELVRLVADLTGADTDGAGASGAGLGGRVQARVLSQRAAELAAVHPEATGLPHSYVYCAASAFDDASHWGPNQVVMKLYVPPGKGVDTPLSSSSGSTGMDFWAPGDRCFVNQPAFVPRTAPHQQRGWAGEEDDGWLLCMVHDAETQRASLSILDAAHVSRGPVATIRLPHHLPAAQHSTCIGHYLGPAQAAPPNWRSHAAAPPAPVAV